MDIETSVAEPPDVKSSMDTKATPDVKPSIEEIINEYYYTTESYILPSPSRLQPQRKAAMTSPQYREESRESCSPTFPIGKFIKKILQTPSWDYTKYMFAYKYQPGFYPSYTKGDFVFYNYAIVSRLNPTEESLYRFALANGIPILGVAFVVLDDKGSRHQIAFLLRKSLDPKFTYNLVLFETYDTDHFYPKAALWYITLWEFIKNNYAEPGSTAMIQRIVKTAKAVRGLKGDEYINLQERDPKEYGRCVQWALVFLNKLKDLDLRNTPKEHFVTSVYNPILENLDAAIASVRGAGRKKSTLSNKMKNPVKKILKAVHKTAKRVLGMKARKTRKNRRGGAYKFF